MQIADLACTVPDSRVLYERSGDMFDLYAAPYESVREAGQWNQIEIRVDHGHVQFVQNGRTTVDTTLWTAAWKARVAQTKFAHWPNFAAFHQRPHRPAGHGGQGQQRPADPAVVSRHPHQAAVGIAAAIALGRCRTMADGPGARRRRRHRAVPCRAGHWCRWPRRATVAAARLCLAASGLIVSIDRAMAPSEARCK